MLRIKRGLRPVSAYFGPSDARVPGSSIAGAQRAGSAGVRTTLFLFPDPPPVGTRSRLGRMIILVLKTFFGLALVIRRDEESGSCATGFGSAFLDCGGARSGPVDCLDQNDRSGD